LPDLERDDVVAAFEVGARAAGPPGLRLTAAVEFLIDAQLPARLARAPDTRPGCLAGPIRQPCREVD